MPLIDGMMLKTKNMLKIIGITILICIIISIFTTIFIVRHEERQAFCQGLCLAGEADKMDYVQSSKTCSCYQTIGSVSPFFELDLTYIYPPFS